MDEQTGEKTQNMLVDHLFQCRISPWPKTAEKRGLYTGVMDRLTDGWINGQTNGPMDGPTFFYRCVPDGHKKDTHEIDPAQYSIPNHVSFMYLWYDS